MEVEPVDLDRELEVGVREIEVVRATIENDLELSLGDRQPALGEAAHHPIFEIAPARVIARNAMSQHRSQLLGTSPRSLLVQVAKDPVEAAERQQTAAKRVVND